MECYKIENLTFCYPSRAENALNNISFSVKQGEFVALCGKSGCGKTTLLRLLKPSLSPRGEKQGGIYFEGGNISEIGAICDASKIGFVGQNPENQIVTDKVWHELAFGLENLGVKSGEIRARVSETAAFFGIEDWFHQKTAALSGGQKQILNLASIMVMQPLVLILDEPTSRLDPIAANEFLQLLSKINLELGITVIMSEHRLDEVFPLADRVIALDNGHIIADDTPKNIGACFKDHGMTEFLPVPMRVYGAVSDDTDYPVTVREGRAWLSDFARSHEMQKFPETSYSNDSALSAVTLKDVYFRYEKDEKDIMRGLNMNVKKGEMFALLGGNGAGKSTMLSLIAGINSPYSGKVLINNTDIKKAADLYDIIGYLPQNPQTLFLKKTVKLDLADMVKNLPHGERERVISDTARLCQIDNLLEYHPYDLSGGEIQRAALCKLLLKKPQILLLDEPTKGVDAHFKIVFADILKRLKANGATILMVSHDIEFCAENADVCAMLFDGQLSAAVPAREFFAKKSFYTTSANRMSRGIIENAVTAADIIKACGGKEERREQPEFPYDKPKTLNNIQEQIIKSKEKKPSKRTLFSVLFILLSVPLTVLFGKYCLGDRIYFVVSLMIIFETLIPFFAAFEKRKIKARGLVIISVMCALAIASRAAFFMLPQFKPVTAIIIIAGISLGAETGFLVGAVTAFVSNFYFGQGMWTPWQMLAWGLIGFTAGILYEKGVLKCKKLPLCIFGFVATLCIYGVIMNLSSVLTYQNYPNLKMILTAFAAGLPFDLIHAASTVVFLFFLSKPMIEQLERVKIKYGLL